MNCEVVDDGSEKKKTGSKDGEARVRFGKNGGTELLETYSYSRFARFPLSPTCLSSISLKLRKIPSSLPVDSLRGNKSSSNLWSL